MITAINRKDNRKVLSYRLEDMKYILDNKSFFSCPNCDSELIFVNCTKKIKHFRHKIECGCEWENETEEHISMKKFFIEKMKLDPSNVEVNLGFAIPDIYLKEKKIAIEVQHSSISEEKFLFRTKRYTENGIWVLWVFHPKLIRENIPKFIRKAHELYYGRIYCILNKKLMPVHLDKKEKWIPEYIDYSYYWDNIYPDMGYYDEGEKESHAEIVGGYYKAYKSKRIIKYGNEIIDYDNFKISRNTWKENNYMIVNYWDKKFWGENSNGK